MKKSLYAVLVIILSILGAKAIASTFDKNVELVTKETTDTTGSQNGNDSGGRNMITREK